MNSSVTIALQVVFTTDAVSFVAAIKLSESCVNNSKSALNVSNLFDPVASVEFQISKLIKVVNRSLAF